MAQTRIFYAPTRLPFYSTATLLFVSYELYRINAGTHPYFSPRLEKAGILHRRAQKPQPQSQPQAPAPATEAIETRGEAGWMWINGVPIPSYDMLTRPFRRD